MSDSKENSFADIIKKTITEATRSIAEEPDLEVTFSDEPPHISGKIIKLRDPGSNLSKEDLTVPIKTVEEIAVIETSRVARRMQQWGRRLMQRQIVVWVNHSEPPRTRANTSLSIIC